MQTSTILAWLLLMCSAAQPYAQNSASLSKESLLKDPNILWVAQSEELIILEPNNPEFEEDRKYRESLGIYDIYLRHLNYMHQPKCYQLKNQFNRQMPLVTDEDMSLGRLLFHSEPIAQLNLYRNSACNQPLPKPNRAALGMTDTIANLDPETKLYSYEIITNELPYAEMRAYKVQQLLYFDQQANNFGSLLISFAPMVQLYDQAGTALGQHTFPCWLPIKTLAQPANLNEERLPWARQTHTHFRPKRLQTLKASKSLPECFDLQLSTIRQNYQTEDVRDREQAANKLPSDELQNMGILVDSVIVFDPETFEEILDTVYIERLAGKDLFSICLVQEWYWDEKAKQMQAHNLFAAPVLSRPTELKDLSSEPRLLFYKPIK